MITNKQKTQEEKYVFPYHYLDLCDEAHRLLYAREYLSYLGIVKDFIKPFLGQYILDAGCGDGRFCYELMNENVKLVGIDLSEGAIRFARVFCPKVEFYVQDLKNLDLPYKFDFIIMLETLEHLNPTEIPRILRNLSAILKDNGKLIITTPSSNVLISEKHYQHFTEDTLRNILKPYFNIIKIQGQDKLGIQKMLFLFFLRIGMILFPFSRRLRFLRRLYSFLDSYYKKYLEVCQPQEGARLIAVCKKLSQN